MKAYFGNEALKQECIATMKGHREADTLVKGVYWQDAYAVAVAVAVAAAARQKARVSARIKQADKLIELLEAA